MGASEARRKRREEKQREQALQEAAAEKAAPAPAAEAPEQAPATPSPAPAPSRRLPEIDFKSLPGDGLIVLDELAEPVVKRAKTVRTDGMLARHIDYWLQGKRTDYQEATNALWRALLREDHMVRQQALAQQAETGQVPEVRPGPLMRALFAELTRMDAEPKQ